jgi:hypothetical protein
MNLDEDFDIVCVGSGLSGMPFQLTADRQQNVDQVGWMMWLSVAELLQLLRKGR